MLSLHYLSKTICLILLWQHFKLYLNEFCTNFEELYNKYIWNKLTNKNIKASITKKIENSD
jgi:hypothetical protein